MFNSIGWYLWIRQNVAKSVSACLIEIAQADGRRFITPKQLSKSKGAKLVQKAFAENFASQCGYCTPGFVAGITSCSTKVC